MFNLKTSIVGMMLLLVLQLQGCGRKGPLYMPQEPVKPVAESKVKAEQVATEPNQSVPNQTIPSQTDLKK